MKVLLILVACACSVVFGQEEKVPIDIPIIPFDPNGCGNSFANGCPNTCIKNGQICCYCELCKSAIYGLTQSCSCCPKDSTCCNNNPLANTGGTPLCCPSGSVCDKGGCVIKKYVLPIYGSVLCSTCGPSKVLPDIALPDTLPAK